MNDLITTHVSDFNCIIPQTIYFSAKYDYEIAAGNNIKDAISENDLAITVIGDTYITNDGSKIAKITAEVEIVDYQESLTYNTDEHIFYGVPRKYIYENGKCLKKEQEIRTIYTFATENNDYSNFKSDSYKILNILDYEIHDSIKISELDKLVLITNIPDQILANQAEQEAKLRLINK